MKCNGKQRIDILLIVNALLAAFLNMFNIWKDQYANAFYTAAVTSMLQSFHTFFYASFDPAGFVTVDKPPVAFWIQTFSAYLFGVHGWSVILPQALAGVASVLMVYVVVKPSFGKTAARLSSLVMASTPIAAAVSRTNNVDSMLVFTLLVGTWMLFRAIRREKWSWAIAAFAMVGVGFNEKMLEAYLVLPAFYVLYLVAFKTNWKKKLGILTGATIVLLVSSLSWAVIVDMIPKTDRPYIGSSQTNSVLELALGYNGIQRLTGNRRGGPEGQDNRAGERTSQQQMQKMQQQMPPNGGPQWSGPAPNGANGGSGQTRTNFSGRGPYGPMGRGMFGTGNPGPLRLFQSGLSGQISWLLPFVAFALVGLLAGVRRRIPLTAKQKESFFWLAWLLPDMTFFSMAGFFHQYYLIMLAPPIAALAGAGWVELWNLYRSRQGWKTWILPVGLIATTLFEFYVLHPYIDQIGLDLSIGVGVLGIGLSLVLCFSASREKLAYTSALGGMIVLLAAPLYWAATPLLYGGNSTMPEAGPQLKASRPGAGWQGIRNEGIDTKLLTYLTQNNTGQTYLFATTNAGTAEPYIIQTGKAVMAMGGFSGSDPILTVNKLKQMVDKKEVKYFLIPSGGSGGGFWGGFDGANSQVLDWIRQHSTEVPKEQWQSTSSNSLRGMDRGGSMMLYEINP